MYNTYLDCFKIFVAILLELFENMTPYESYLNFSQHAELIFFSLGARVAVINFKVHDCFSSLRPCVCNLSVTIPTGSLETVIFTTGQWPFARGGGTACVPLSR